MEIGHLDSKKIHFYQKLCKLGKFLIAITLLMHKILLIELITITNSRTCPVQFTLHIFYVPRF